jgi:hypothetical protein
MGGLGKSRIFGPYGLRLPDFVTILALAPFFCCCHARGLLLPPRQHVLQHVCSQTRVYQWTAVRSQPRWRSNLLFLMADDHAGYVFGADGNRKPDTRS